MIEINAKYTNSKDRYNNPVSLKEDFYSIIQETIRKINELTEKSIINTYKIYLNAYTDNAKILCCFEQLKSTKHESSDKVSKTQINLHSSVSKNQGNNCSSSIVNKSVNSYSTCVTKKGQNSSQKVNGLKISRESFVVFAGKKTSEVSYEKRGLINQQLFCSEMNILINNMTAAINTSFNKITELKYERFKVFKNNVIYYLGDVLSPSGRIQDIINKSITFNVTPASQNDQKFQQNTSKITPKIPDIIKKNFYESKEIEEKYITIIDKFKTSIGKYIDDDEEIENMAIGTVLVKIARTVRSAYNDANFLLKIVYDQFEKDKEKNIGEKELISSPDFFKEEFSEWAKENKSKVLETTQNFKSKDFKDDKYIAQFYNDFLLFFFECELSIPAIKVDFSFSKDEEFNAEKMNEYPPNKKKRKVNFVYFPALISNESYLRRGKKWVFTYVEGRNKTFVIKDPELGTLFKKNRFKIPGLRDKFKIDVQYEKFYAANLNFKVHPRVNQEYVFYLKDKKSGEIKKVVAGGNKVRDEDNKELVKLEYKFMDEVILSSVFK